MNEIGVDEDVFVKLCIMSYIVFFVFDFEKMSWFYIDCFGFVVIDWFINIGLFLCL